MFSRFAVKTTMNLALAGLCLILSSCSGGVSSSQQSQPQGDTTLVDLQGLIKPFSSASAVTKDMLQYTFDGANTLVASLSTGNHFSSKSFPLSLKQGNDNDKDFDNFASYFPVSSKENGTEYIFSYVKGTEPTGNKSPFHFLINSNGQINIADFGDIFPSDADADAGFAVDENQNIYNIKANGKVYQLLSSETTCLPLLTCKSSKKVLVTLASLVDANSSFVVFGNTLFTQSTFSVKAFNLKTGALIGTIASNASFSRPFVLKNGDLFFADSSGKLYLFKTVISQDNVSFKNLMKSSVTLPGLNLNAISQTLDGSTLILPTGSGSKLSLSSITLN